MNKLTLVWFNREVSRKLAAVAVIFFPFQYTYLQYRGIKGIDTFFEDMIAMYYVANVIIYALYSKTKKVEFESFWVRFGLSGFQLSYLLLMFAYFLFRLHMGYLGSLLQLEEDILSIIVIAMITSIIILLFSVICSLLSIERKKIILDLLKTISKLYFYFGVPFYVLYLIWRYFLEIEEKGILFYFLMTYTSFTYMNLILMQYYRYKKEVPPTPLLRVSKWAILSFGLAFIIFLAVRLIISFT